MAAVWMSRVSRWLEALFNVKGGPTVVDIAPQLQPVIVWHDGVDSNPTSGWYRYAVAQTVPAVAAALGVLRLRNPAGSNVIAVVEKILVTNSGAIQPLVIAELRPSTVDFTPAASTPLDSRGQLLPTLVASVGSAGAQVGASFALLQFATGTSQDYILNVNQELPVEPTNSLSVWGTVVNTAFNVHCVWRERAMQQSELT